MAEQLAGRGFDLVLDAEDDGRLQHAARRIRAAGAAVVEADLPVPQQTDAPFATATTLGRPLDVVVLSAGVGQGARSRTPTWRTSWKSSISASARPCDWPKASGATWPPGTRAAPSSLPPSLR
ncbi:hypothetical protein [Streptomyces sp. NPDC014623]|uniref:hypothetical protein n=1 Tax=Streptomyces sp. NPDC014623 TaxID=3364875 RepID=UPI0036FB916F